MLLSLKKTLGFGLHGSDGLEGKIQDYFFDFHTWEIRHLVAHVGHFWNSRNVLLDPQKMAAPELSGHTFPVRLSKKEILAAPGVESDMPKALANHATSFFSGLPYGGVFPGSMEVWNPNLPEAHEPSRESGDKINENLASLSHLWGRPVDVIDGYLGQVEDAAASIGEGPWKIWALVVDLSHWLPGKKVMVPRSAIGTLDGMEEEVYLTISRGQAESLPHFIPGMLLSPLAFQRAFDLFGRSAEPC